MNEERWNELFKEIRQEYRKEILYRPFNPENWSMLKDAYLKFIKNVDELTEVYNSDNIKKEK